MPVRGIEPASVAPTKSTPICTHSGRAAALLAAIGALYHRMIGGEKLAHAEIAAHNLRMESGDYKYIW